MVVKSLALSVLERVVNAYLKALPESEDYLHPLAGQLIEIHVMPYELCFIVHPTATQVLFLPESNQQPDLTLTGWLSGFLAMAAGENTAPLFAKTVTMDGDSALARRFQSLLAALKIDWPLALSHYAGPVAASWAESMIEQASATRNRLADAWQAQIREWLQEETRALPTRLELEQWCGQVDELRSDAERLALRLEKLANRV